MEYIPEKLFARVHEENWNRKWQPTPIFLLENSMDRETWWATVHGVTKESDMTEHSTGET